MVTKATPIDGVIPAHTIGTIRPWSQLLFLLPGEDISKPLPKPLNVLLFLAKKDQEAKGEREWGLEWAVVGYSSSIGNEQVEEETKYCDANNNTSNSLIHKE